MFETIHLCFNALLHDCASSIPSLFQPIPIYHQVVASHHYPDPLGHLIILFLPLSQTSIIFFKMKRKKKTLLLFKCQHGALTSSFKSLLMEVWYCPMGKHVHPSRDYYYSSSSSAPPKYPWREFQVTATGMWEGICVLYNNDDEIIYIYTILLLCKLLSHLIFDMNSRGGEMK